MAARETYQPAFDEPAGKVLLGTSTVNLTLPTPYISYGLPYNEACASHVSSTFHASRVYIIASNSLAISTDRVDRLVSSIGEDRVVKVRIGVKAHTMWSDILSIVAECRDTSADCVVTIGAGSITDCAKVVVMVSATRKDHPGVTLS